MVSDCIISDGYRVDPASKGIHLINVESGGHYVYIPFKKIDNIINILSEVKKQC